MEQRRHHISEVFHSDADEQDMTKEAAVHGG
jgi:ABC-2 type transport system ATP-binding protein